MKSFLDKIFLRSNNLDHISFEIKQLTKKTPAKLIFDAIDTYSKDSEVRYVGGCIRKIINKEKVDDIDLATNLKPDQVCEAMKKNNINYYESGLSHGTITASIDEFKFEITTLREDVETYGRHADVKFSKDWKKDASRRDFTINSIYSDKDGNIFDPFNGRQDLQHGLINFIGDADKRIKEDYLRILRYLRFFLDYSKQPHNLEVLRKIRLNIGKIADLSKERLLDELKKIINLGSLQRLSKDKVSRELISLVFPELKNISLFSNLSENKKEILKNEDFIFLLSLMIIDEKDNLDYFLFKYNISKKDQKRMQIIDHFFKQINLNNISENTLNNIFYFKGRQAVIDILNFRIIKLKKTDNIVINLLEVYKNKKMPILPIKAETLMVKYKIPEGKQLGKKLKIIEKEWVDNNFKISDEKIESIVKN
tara:strand:- start:1813 stop:3084 length:1272 start_codon:yes stop_codon:yes gene_type:complete